MSAEWGGYPPVQWLEWWCWWIGLKSSLTEQTKAVDERLFAFKCRVIFNTIKPARRESKAMIMEGPSFCKYYSKEQNPFFSNINIFCHRWILTLDLHVFLFEFWYRRQYKCEDLCGPRSRWRRTIIYWSCFPFSPLYSSFWMKNIWELNMFMLTMLWLQRHQSIWSVCLVNHITQLPAEWYIQYVLMQLSNPG